MQNAPGLLSVSKSQQFQCEDCSLIFDSQKILQNHKLKYCINSKYGQLQTLQQQFYQKSKGNYQSFISFLGRDISLYGMNSKQNKLSDLRNQKNIKQQISYLDQNSQMLGLNSVLKNNGSVMLDKQYQSVLDQLTNKQSLKKKLQKQKNQAYQELQFLQKRQNDLLIDTKQQELHQILKQRKMLQEQEKKIEEQMKLYEKKKKQMDKEFNMVDREDYIYKQARQAGKLAKEREILQQKKRQLQHNLKKKKKQRNQIQHFLNQSGVKEKDIYIPKDFRKKDDAQLKKETNRNNRKVMSSSNPSIKDSLDSLQFQNTNRNEVKSRGNNFNNPYGSIAPPSSIPHQNVGTQHWNQNQRIQLQHISPLQRSTTQVFNLPHQKHSNPLTSSPMDPQDDTYPYFTPQVFSKNQKLLTDMLNRNGKSEEDLFIQQLNAQEYDSLNLLAKIPKGSQLYELKLKQYQELSKLRDDYKKQAHQKRIEKMKRQFQYQKKLMSKQMENAAWVDQNRKMMLAQQINIVKKQQQWQKQKNMMRPNPYNQRMGNPNDIPNDMQSMYNNPNNNPNQMPPSNNSIPRNNNNGQIPSIQHLPNNNFYKPPSNQNINNNRASELTNAYNNYNNVGSMNRLSNAANNNPRKFYNQQQDNYQWRYKINIDILKNYKRSKPIKIKVVVKQHDVTSQFNEPSNSQLLNYQFSTSYHWDKAKTQDVSGNLNMNNKYDKQKVDVLYREEFMLPINLQELYNQKQNQLYLFVFALEKDQNRLSNQPTIYGWYNMKITHFGQLKEGRFNVALYGDPSTFPNPSDMNKKKNKLKQEIVIQIGQVIIEKPRPEQDRAISQQRLHQAPTVVQIPGSNNKVPQDTVTSGYSQKQKQNNDTPKSLNSNVTSKQPFKNTKNNGNTSQTSILNNSKENMNATKRSSIKQPDTTFIPNQLETQFVKLKKKESKNMDITLAQLRTLPSYIGPVKIEVSFIDKQNAEVLPRFEVLCQLSSPDMYNPLINYVKKIRNEKLLTPTTILFIRFLALNSLDYEVYNLGFTIFYMFFDGQTQVCKDNKLEEYLLSTGYFQLPIFWGNIDPHYCTIEEVVNNYPLIPCASILIGCNMNAKQKPLPIPKYHQKVYNTLLFNVDEIEIKLFQQQYKRQKLDANKILNGYLKYKGISSGYTVQQAKNYIFKVMSFTKDNLQNLFPLEYMTEYTEYFGLSFSIDKLIVPQQQQNYYYFVTVCLVPQGKYYTSKLKQTSDLNIIYAIDPQNSRKHQIAYQQSQIAFQPKYNINTCLIVEFKRIKIGKQNVLGGDVQNYAYVIIPVFKQVEGVRSLNAMKDTVNTYSGHFDYQQIKQVKKNLPDYLDKLTQKIKPSQIQLSFRLMNGFFTNQWSAQKPEPPKNRKQRYLAWYSRPIDFQDAKKKVKIMIQRKIGKNL